jgi:hypothetical protein
VLLMPSRMGGDRYRIRAFVDPVGVRAFDGTEGNAVKAETGRFCVWKHVLWSRMIVKRLPAFSAQNTVLGVQQRLVALGFDTGNRDGIAGDRTRRAVLAFQNAWGAGLPTNGAWNDGPTQAAIEADYQQFLTGRGQSLANMSFPFATGQFRMFYNTLELDTDASTPLQVSAAEYQAAMQWVRQTVHATPPAGLSRNYNILVAIEDEFEQPSLFKIRDPRHYNRTRGAGFAAVPAAGGNYPSYWTDMQRILYDGTRGVVPLFIRYFAGRASVAAPPTANLTALSSPGITVIQALDASIMMSNPNRGGQPQINSNATTGASGWATAERGCYIWYGATTYNNWPYQGDGFSRNTMHEVGHTLYLRHGFTQVGGTHANASFPEDHDQADRCLMGYLFCEGEYCGKCHLKLRGWDISQLPVP